MFTGYTQGNRDYGFMSTNNCSIDKNVVNVTLGLENFTNVTGTFAPTLLFNPFLPTVPTFAVRETQSLGQQMLNATVGINGLKGPSIGLHYAERRQSLGQQMLERWAKMG